MTYTVTEMQRASESMFMQVERVLPGIHFVPLDFGGSGDRGRATDYTATHRDTGDTCRVGWRARRTVDPTHMRSITIRYSVLSGAMTEYEKLMDHTPKDGSYVLLQGWFDNGVLAQAIWVPWTEANATEARREESVGSILPVDGGNRLLNVYWSYLEGASLWTLDGWKEV